MPGGARASFLTLRRAQGKREKVGSMEAWARGQGVQPERVSCRPGAAPRTQRAATAVVYFGGISLRTTAARAWGTEWPRAREQGSCPGPGDVGVCSASAPGPSTAPGERRKH